MHFREWHAMTAASKEFCNAANEAKGTMSIEQFIALCADVVKCRS